MQFSPIEVQALEAMLPTMGAHIAEKGLGTKAFNDFSRDEILRLFAATVRTFRTKLEEVIGDDDIPF